MRMPAIRNPGKTPARPSCPEETGREPARRGRRTACAFPKGASSRTERAPPPGRGDKAWAGSPGKNIPRGRPGAGTGLRSPGRKNAPRCPEAPLSPSVLTQNRTPCYDISSDPLEILNDHAHLLLIRSQGERAQNSCMRQGQALPSAALPFSDRVRSERETLFGVLLPSLPFPAGPGCSRRPLIV